MHMGHHDRAPAPTSWKAPTGGTANGRVIQRTEYDLSGWREVERDRYELRYAQHFLLVIRNPDRTDQRPYLSFCDGKAVGLPSNTKRQAMTKAMNSAKGNSRPGRAKHGKQANWDTAMIAKAAGELNIDPASFQPVPSFEPQPEIAGNPFTTVPSDPIEVDPHLELELEEVAAAPSVPAEPDPAPELPPQPDEAPEPEPEPEPELEPQPEPERAPDLVPAAHFLPAASASPQQRLTVEISGELAGANVLLIMQEVEGALGMLRTMGTLRCRVIPVGGIEL